MWVFLEKSFVKYQKTKKSLETFVAVEKGGVQLLSHLRRLLSDSIAFSITTIGNRFVGLLLTPVYAYYFSERAFADWGQVNVFTLFLTYICLLGTDSAVAFYYFDTKDLSERKSYLSSAILFSAIICFVITCLVYIFDQKFSMVIFKDYTNHQMILPVACLATVAAIIIQHLLAYMRYERKVLLFIIFSISYVAGTNLLSALMVSWQPGVLTLFYGQLIGQGIIALILLIILHRYVTFKISKKHLYNLIKYGAPLLPSLLSFWVLIAGPRGLIFHLDSAANAATYEAILKVATFINLLTAPFFLAWRPFSLSLKDREDSPALFGLVARILLILGTILIMLMQFNMKFLVSIYLPKYVSGYIYVWTLALATLLNVLHTVFGVGLLIEKRTKTISYIFMLTAPFCFMTAWILIPRYHIWGATAATLLSYFFIITFIIKKNQEINPINIKISSIVYYICIFIVCMIITSYVDYYNFNYRWIYNLTLFSLLMLCIIKLRLISKSQILLFINMLKSSMKGKSKLERG